MTDLFSVAGKVALVTGATSGIGLMIARGLVQGGARVYLVARNRDDCNSVAAELSQDGEAVALPNDISTLAGVSRLVSDFAASEEKLEILVNSAGISVVAPFEAFGEDAWDTVFDVNLKAIFFLTQRLLPALRAGARNGCPASIINIGSIGGLRVGPRENYSYGSSKAGLHHITKVLAKRLGPDQITVNAIAPGFFPSRITEGAPEIGKAVTAQAPLRRVGVEQDIAAAAIYFGSRAGSYVTGTVLPVDGGFSL